MATIIDIQAKQRNCGWRKKGALYLVGPATTQPCGRLPQPLTTCPTCGEGIRHSRNWRRINPKALFTRTQCKNHADSCQWCPLHIIPDTAYLLWIGAKYYKTPIAYAREASQLGISRRIKTLPRDYIIGESLILLAHVKGHWQATYTDTPTPRPAIIAATIPTAVHYILRHGESEEQLDRMEKRGITIVREIDTDRKENEP